MKVKENCLILIRKTGIGNQVQFTPVIDHLMNRYYVMTDSDVLIKIGACHPWDGQVVDIIYIPFGNYTAFDILKICLRFPFAEKIGYTYRIFGRHFSFGLHRAYRFDHDRHEVLQNCENFGGVPRYKKYEGKKAGVIMHYVNRPERAIPDKYYLAADWIVGDKPTDEILSKKYIPTPTIYDLIRLVRDAAVYVGPDTGVMHLADYFGCECRVFFGPTSAKKSGCLNGTNYQSKLDCSPCYRWGKVHCINPLKYECLNFSTNEIL